MTFIDSGSTDNTLNILHQFAIPSHAEIRVAQTGLKFWDHQALHQVRNTIWKESQYDLVLFPDLDEIFYYPNIKRFLNENRFDIYEMEGYEMFSVKMPAKGSDILKINKGVKFTTYNKSTIFNPKIDIQFLNAHLRYTKCSNINIGNIKLLHYRCLGLDMMRKRNKRESDRLPQKCKYRSPLTEKEILKRYNDLKIKAKKVI